MILSWLSLVHAKALLPARSVLIGFAALGVLASANGCSLIDDFSQFRIVRGDAGDDDAGSVSGRDAAVPLCGGEDCSRLTRERDPHQRCVGHDGPGDQGFNASGGPAGRFGHDD